MGFEIYMLVWEVERDVGGGLETLQILAFRRNGAYFRATGILGASHKSLANHRI